MSTHLTQGPFSFMICFFTIASNAMSGVKSPVLKPTKRRRKRKQWWWKVGSPFDYIYFYLDLASTRTDHSLYTVKSVVAKIKGLVFKICINVMWKSNDRYWTCYCFWGEFRMKCGVSLYVRFSFAWVAIFFLSFFFFGYGGWPRMSQYRSTERGCAKHKKEWNTTCSSLTHKSPCKLDIFRIFASQIQTSVFFLVMMIAHLLQSLCDREACILQWPWKICRKGLSTKLKRSRVRGQMKQSPVLQVGGWAWG